MLLSISCSLCSSKTTKSYHLVPIHFQYGQQITVNWLDSESVVTLFHQSMAGSHHLNRTKQT